MALARYEAQVGTNIDVLTAQASLTQAEAYYTTAKADYLISLSRLYISMGESSPSLRVASGNSPVERISRPADYTPAPESCWPLSLPWTPYDYKTPDYMLYPAGQIPAQPITYDTEASAGQMERIMRHTPPSDHTGENLSPRQPPEEMMSPALDEPQQ